MRTQMCLLLKGAYSTQALRSTAILRTPVYQATAPATCFGSQKRRITTKSKSRSPVSVAMMRAESADHDNVYKSDYASVPIPEMPVTSMIFQEAHKWAHKIAIECGLTGRNYTYGELQDATWRWGGMMQKIWGADSNPTVAILSPNTPEYPIVYYGSIAAGAIVTTINAAYTPGEIAGHLSDSGAEMLIVDSVMEPLADAALQILQKNIPIYVNGSSAKGRPNVQEIVKDSTIPFAVEMEYDPDYIAALPYSSGTTGKPKGVYLSHHGINGAMALYHFPEAKNVEKAEGEHQDVLMGLLPFFHIYGMMTIMASGLINGTKIVTLPRFDPKTYVSVLKQKKMTMLHTVPPLLHFLAASPVVTTEDLSHVHTVMCGAASVPPVAARALKEKAGHSLFFQEGLGSTEALTTHMTPKGGEKLGYCGKLVPSVCARLVDLETGVNLPAGEKGELYIKSPAIMSGYHNNPQATKDTIDEEGWLRTGDVAVCDEDGYFAIVDRLKDLIKVKGLQVSPSEIEDVILSHPGVANVGVVGVKDERSGEAPRAYIIPRHKDLTEKDIHTYLEDKIARHKKLVGGIRFVTELPQNATGKLLRRKLKQIAEEEGN